MLLIILGIIAGMLTTLSGFGGGLFLLVSVSLLWDPLTALAVTAAALLAGSLQRLYLFRSHVCWQVAGLFVVGVVPGCLAGAWLAVSVPAVALRALILIMALLGAVHALAQWAWRLPARALVPSGAAIGVISASAGGVGPLVGPLFLSTGLQGNAYIATISAAAVAINGGRLIGYGAGGMVGTGTVWMAAVLALGLMAGNWLGRTCRDRMGEDLLRRVEVLAPFVCAVLALVGLGRP